MTGNQPDSRQFTQEEIRRYTRGEMTPGEMHAIEMAALEDPFLADALEGYEEAIIEKGDPAIQQTEAALDLAFAGRIKKEERQKAPVIKIKWWQAAAAAAIITTAGVLGHNSFESRSNEVILSYNETSAKNKQTAPAADSDATDKPEESANALNYTQDSVTSEQLARDANEALSKARVLHNDNESAKDANAPVETKPTHEQRVIISNAENSKTQKESGYDDKIPSQTASESAKDRAKNQSDIAAVRSEVRAAKQARSEERLRTDTNLIESIVISKPESAKKEAEAAAPIAKNRRRRGKADTVELNGKVAGVTVPGAENMLTDIGKLNAGRQYFSGQIVNFNNQPLSNAVITVVSNKAAYFTDNNGKFLIPSTDSVLEFDVSLIGMAPGRFNIRKPDTAGKIVLSESERSLSEVVVTGYG
ncbi:MAG: hypothetical protein EOO02_02840, partial [Chitinophagaceae bacterium]